MDNLLIGLQVVFNLIVILRLVAISNYLTGYVAVVNEAAELTRTLNGIIVLAKERRDGSED
jgi:hypothetical protein